MSEPIGLGRAGERGSVAALQWIRAVSALSLPARSSSPSGRELATSEIASTSLIRLEPQPIARLLYHVAGGLELAEARPTR